MLILTRHVGQTLFVGDKITVTVLRAKGYQVRLGIVAPPNVSVDREEIRRLKEKDAADALSACLPAVAPRKDSSPFR
jgi:carbon storage regulator